MVEVKFGKSWTIPLSFDCKVEFFGGHVDRSLKTNPGTRKSRVGIQCPEDVMFDWRKIKNGPNRGELRAFEIRAPPRGESPTPLKVPVSHAQPAGLPHRVSSNLPRSAIPISSVVNNLSPEVAMAAALQVEKDQQAIRRKQQITTYLQACNKVCKADLVCHTMHD